MESVKTMAAELSAEKNRNGYTRKLYKAQSDEHKGSMLRDDILNRVSAMKSEEKKRKVNFSNIDEVRSRTYAYWVACADAEVYPSIMGLAVHGYGVSRQALNNYLLTHNNETTDFINRVKDEIADTLVNASLYGNANAIQTIFQLKNHFGHSDKVEIEAVTEAPVRQTAEELIRQAAMLPNYAENL